MSRNDAKRTVGGFWRDGLLLTLWRHKLIVGIVYLGVVWTGISLLLSAKPTYDVNAVVAIQPRIYRQDRDNVAVSSRPEDVTRPQVALVESEDVIRRAIALVGAERLNPDGSDPARRLLDAPLSPVDAAYRTVKKALSVRTEPFTNLVEVSFQHPDPALAVAFIKALLQVFIEKHYELYSNATAVAFFLEQQRQTGDEFRHASAALTEFASSAQIFDVNEQRRLYLDRHNRIASDLAALQGTIIEKERKAAIIPSQLEQMKPINRLPQVVALTQSSNERRTPVLITPKESTSSRLASDPPLLLVRVYQDTIAELVKLNIDLAGMHAREAHQAAELKQVEADLVTISTKEAKFERLRQDVAEAKTRSEFFSRKAFEEQLTQDLKARKLSNVQVVQQPTVPLDPVWPKRMILAVGILLSLMPLLGLPIVHQLAARRHREIATRTYRSRIRVRRRPLARNDRAPSSDLKRRKANLDNGHANGH